MLLLLPLHAAGHVSPFSPDGFPAQSQRVRDRLLPVQDVPSPCPYIDSLTARMPLHYPIERLGGQDIDALLAGGFRRSGMLLYYTRCAPCHACEPTRVDVDKFRQSGSFKRVLRRAQRELTLTWQAPIVDQARIDLYNSHRAGRGLGAGPPIDASNYHAFLTESCMPTLELEMRRDGRLIGISIMDIGDTAISAVYTHFDPAESRYSPGTLAVLHQIQWARQNARQWAYLGLYVSSNPHLNYKSRFGPQQRLIAGQWRDILTPPLDPEPVDGG